MFFFWFSPPQPKSFGDTTAILISGAVQTGGGLGLAHRQRFANICSRPCHPRGVGMVLPCQQTIWYQTIKTKMNFGVSKRPWVWVRGEEARRGSSCQRDWATIPEIQLWILFLFGLPHTCQSHFQRECCHTLCNCLGQVTLSFWW